MGGTTSPAGVDDIAVEVTVDPLTLPTPGGNFRVGIRILNTGANQVTINSIGDNLLGDLTSRRTPIVTI